VNASPGKVETALFAVGFAMAGLVILALVWSGTGAYADIARANGVTGTTFVMDPAGARGSVQVDLPRMVEWHQVWATYVTGGSETPGVGPRFEDWFTNEERSHMADVRRVFDSVKILIPAGMFVMALRMQRARARGLASLLRLIRNGAIAAGVAVAVVGVVAAVAFDAAFLLFHQIFFPQGNFLFDPATSNLLRLYPDWYWQGITLRIGLSFIGLAVAVAVAAAVGLRRALH
jgi:integral membrane protein (TIGR01906 family)